MSHLRRIIQSARQIMLTNLKNDFANNSFGSPFIINKSQVMQKYQMCTKVNPLIDESAKEEPQKVKLGELGMNRKLKLGFTCKKCNTRNYKIMSKIAYEKGLVIVKCDGCKKNHLIADNLGWFAEWKNIKNVENFLKLKGEKVQRIRNDVEGYFEAVSETELKRIEEEQEELRKRHNSESN